MEELQATQQDLAETQGALQDTQTELTGTKHSLKRTEHKLEDVTVVLTEHKSVGNALYDEGTSLLSTSEAMKQDIGGLFGKLSRKSAVESSNLQVASSYMTDVQLQVKHASEQLAVFKDDQVARSKALQQQVRAGLRMHVRLFVSLRCLCKCEYSWECARGAR